MPFVGVAFSDETSRVSRHSLGIAGTNPVLAVDCSWQLTAPVRRRTYLARPHPPRRARLRWLSLWAAALPRTDCARLYWNPRRSSALARPCSSAAFVTQARRSRHSGPPPSNLASRAALARADRARPHWPVLARRLPAAFAHSALARRARPLRSIPPRSIPPRSARSALRAHGPPRSPALTTLARIAPCGSPAPSARRARPLSSARRASPLRFGPPRSRAPLWPTALALCPPGPTLTSPARCAESSPRPDPQAQRRWRQVGGRVSAPAQRAPSVLWTCLSLCSLALHTGWLAVLHRPALPRSRTRRSDKRNSSMLTTSNKPSSTAILHTAPVKP